jgi:MoxR-like ATPase
MINPIKLSGFDREFFELAGDAAYLNPFGPKHQETVRKLAKLVCRERADAVSWPEMIPLVVGRIENIIKFIEHGVWPAPVKIEYFDMHDREVVKYGLLFWIFSRYIEDYDEFIRRQERQPEKNRAADFESKITYEMSLRGIGSVDAVRYFSLFYQMRRAIYFIQKGLTGQSDCMRQLREDLWNTLFTHDIRGYDKHLWGRMEDFTILLEGPTGCGKGTAAGIVGRSSALPFQDGKCIFESNFMDLVVPANLSQYSPGLVESELFGHAAGAFTGAVSEYGGLFGQCRPHGVIFLDEIGELSAQVQVKLLKVLEERSYTSVGSAAPKRFSGRVIAATNRPMAELRRQGTFREDLYYRLCADCIVVPSLALRIEQNPGELRELVEHFTRREMSDYNPKTAERVMDVIERRLPKDYAWPGNVRELVQCIRRVLLKDDYRPGERPARTRLDAIAAGVESEHFTAEELTTEYCRYLLGRHGSYLDVAKITGFDWRTVKGKAG